MNSQESPDAKGQTSEKVFVVVARRKSGNRAFKSREEQDAAAGWKALWGWNESRQALGPGGFWLWAVLYVAAPLSIARAQEYGRREQSKIARSKLKVVIN
jgi:hypothetical protein